MAIGPPEGPGSLGLHPKLWTIFWPRCPLNDRRWAASLSKTGRSLLLQGLLYCSLTYLTFRLLLLMGGNVHPNPGPPPTYPCAICTRNVTWRGKSIQCTACSQWVHFRCTSLSAPAFKSLGPSHSWCCPKCTRYTSPVISGSNPITVIPHLDSNSPGPSSVPSSQTSRALHHPTHSYIPPTLHPRHC